jgi:outer membrane protein OmpA-like peptidoglycan-associated protein
MRFNIRKWKVNLLFCASAAILLAGFAYAAADKTRRLATGDKTTVTGSILSRDGDLVRVRDKTSGAVVVVNVTDKTRIERQKHHVAFPRHADMDVTTLVPGLTIDASGVGNPKGELDADRISFTPDEFAVDAQSAAGAMVNQRVSDLDDYKNEFEVDVFFDRDSAVLDETAKRDLANLADIAKPLNGYMIEIAGYASNTLSKETDQKLSEERAAAVARYFREVKGIPMRRILVPVGYGTTQAVVSNKDLNGRELNRRVDIKVLVNKSVRQGL